MMKSVMATGKRNDQGRDLGLRLFAAVALCVLGMMLGGCSWRHPGETVAEVNRRHERVLRLDSEMALSDLDRVLLLDQPSKLTDKRLP